MTKIKHGPLTTAPAPPTHLHEDARAVWREVTLYLAERGVLHSGDLSTIEAYARAAARLRRLEDILDAEGLFTDNGRAHPGITSANTTAATVSKLGGNLGLAPVSRARLAVSVQKGSDKPDAHATEWENVLGFKGKKR